ncbi:MAG: bifunctional phosphopantothenoylcysteine decarboxylase/phosphopantothenate--cysteine ligase CoaBC [Flavobacteriales bacterium]|nr:bifunctional phosphopantothenoylcysteine decarboxylase/phosphopantothenate--cysteine ligase CoaBC [Flavobacteriales bacterium]
MLKGKKILLGVTGSIAAYKAALLVRLFRKEGAEVQVVMTPSGRDFITPVTLSALSGRPVLSEFFQMTDGTWNSHVELGLWADVMLVAPATAATLGKMALGIADNLLTTCYLSCKAPVAVAPAMDLDMYRHPSTQKNLGTLRSYGVEVVEPASGYLASGLEGKGRMEEPENIVRFVDSMLSVRDDFRGKKVLVTAGPTYEKLDPVRFIGNYSSGKMGFALAGELARRGAEVTLVCGPVALPTPDEAIRRIDVESAAQMYDKTVGLFAEADMAVLAAAVADFTPARQEAVKIKRKGPMSLELEPTRDIAAELGKMKKNGQVLVGFALETDAGMDSACGKLERKNLDMIVLNSLSDEGAGFSGDTNKVTLISRGGVVEALPLKSKQDVARDIVDRIPH